MTENEDQKRVPLRQRRKINMIRTGFAVVAAGTPIRVESSAFTSQCRNVMSRTWISLFGARGVKRGIS